jgi:hypothetical protein
MLHLYCFKKARQLRPVGAFSAKLAGRLTCSAIFSIASLFSFSYISLILEKKIIGAWLMIIREVY